MSYKALLISVTLLSGLVAGNATAREIALSFDDTPSPATSRLIGSERTKLIIQKLDSLEIDEVVFFCSTYRLQWHDGMSRLRAYADAGHVIANHSHSHEHPSDLGAKAYLADVHRAHEFLDNLPTFKPWFRYPFLDEGNTLSLRDSIRFGLQEMGYINGYVTIDTYDWYLDSMYREALATDTGAVKWGVLKDMYVGIVCDAAGFYSDMAVYVLGREPKHVLLLHENDLAALFIDDLVAELRRRGWIIISPTEAYKDPLMFHDPDILMNGQGRVAAIAAERGYDGPYRHHSESVEYLDAQIAERRVFIREGAGVPTPAKVNTDSHSSE